MEVKGRVLSGPAYFPQLADAGTIDAQRFIASPASGTESIQMMYLLHGPYLDSDSARFASQAEWGQLMCEGVEIHVHQPAMMHPKLTVVDAKFVSVGSTNFDFRSFRLNGG